LIPWSPDKFDQPAGYPEFVIFRNWFIIRLNATEKQQKILSFRAFQTRSTWGVGGEKTTHFVSPS
jgi:hypothetical protein